MGQAHAVWVTAVALLGAGASACAPNYVQPGFYEAIAAAGSGSAPDSRALQPTAAGGVAPAPTPTAAASAVPPVSAPVTGAASSSGAPVLAPGPVHGTGAGPCDLSGRWLITDKFIVDGQGQLQTVHTWLYYEITQTGDTIMVTRGLQCGEEIVARSAFGADVSSMPSWPAVMAKNSDSGRAGSSQMTSTGCNIRFDKWYATRGATLPYYNDPSRPLPAAEQPATGTTPGWEDWDNDGKPGFTVTVSGIITGKLYLSARAWHAYSGVVADASQTFTLADDWRQEQSVLGYDGSELLTTQGVRAADASLHFADFARLSAAQVSGDDAAICTSIRALAPKLTPKASEK